MRVKELLKEKGLTAKELAGKIGISEAALSLSLKGNPTLERLIQIATALDVPVSDLFAAPSEGVITCPHCGKPITLKTECHE